MKHIAVTVLIASIIVAGIWYMRINGYTPGNSTPIGIARPSPAADTDEDAPLSTVIASGLDTPWALAFLPDRSILVTERSGSVRLIDKNGNLRTAPIAKLQSVKEIGEGGLLGIAIDPEFSQNNFVYLYYTYSSAGDNTLNRVVRMTYRNEALTDETIIIDRIPGASNHNGGRIKFGPDGLLYIGTGDAQEPSQAQSTDTWAGKILRITDEGDPAPGNPFNNPVYSYGHRNIQGITWTDNGSLWATEHGRSGVLSGFDELNLIAGGKNYGWPDIEGDETRMGMETPRRHSGGSTTWAPSGIAFIGQSLFFSGLRGQALYEASLDGNRVVTVQEHFKRTYGRIREVVAGPDGMLYITTSNQDGRGSPSESDDRVIKINPDKLQAGN